MLVRLKVIKRSLKVSQPALVLEISLQSGNLRKDRTELIMKTNEGITAD